MTGNTVLLAVAVGRHNEADTARAGVALVGFCLGVAAGTALIRTGRPWPNTASRAFVVEGLALTALLMLWATLGVDQVRYLLIAVSGIAMGAQSAAVRASDVRGVNTTFMTSTLMNAIARLILRVRGISEGDGPGLPSAAWLTYAGGALIGALAERTWHAGAVAVPLAMVAAVSVAGLDPRPREPG